MKWIAAAPGLLLVSCAATGPGDSGDDRQRQMIALLEKFDRFDYNGDGYLTEAELEQGIREAGVEAPAEPSQIIDFYDRNGDRRISLDEAQAGMRLAAG